MDALNIQVMENGKEIRRSFIAKFTMSWDQFKESHKNWIEKCEAANDPVIYAERYLWELMDYRAISFAQSLEFLRTLQGNVYFMSENESKDYCHGIEVNGVEYKGGVGEMNAGELADLIEYEWYESYRLFSEDMYLTNTVLPEDIYVFDKSMEHLLVFTHETDYWELEDEQPMKCAASRFCMMYGFELPEDVTYGKIRTAVTALKVNASLEISYSCSMYFRQIRVSKRQKENSTRYVYRFDYPDKEYATWEEAENDPVFNDLSLKEVSELSGVRFDIISMSR